MNNSKKIIDACLKSVIACETCISSCLAEEKLSCVLLCRDCADFCALTARFEARESQFSMSLHTLCAEICKTCSEECSKHAAHNEACKTCADACHQCAEICGESMHVSNN